jgi:hypothetical protein
MIAMREVTDWLPAYNHTYLFEGASAVAYIKSGETQPIYFKKPLKIDRRGRKFVDVKINPFTVVSKRDDARHWKVKSKDNVYIVTLASENWNCTCPGFMYRGECKHVVGVGKKYA